MSDEIEAISVEAESPVAGAGTEAPVAVEASAEPVGAEIEATQINLAPADDSLKQNSQQAYLETVAPERVSSAAPITAAGHAAKEAEQEEKKADAHAHFAEQEKHAAARREWMEREHDFGGQKMSGHDLTKLLDFISNPAMQDKLRERLGKSGMPKEKIDKGMKELQEFADLKKKEKEGELSEDQKRRLREIEKSEEFKVTAQQAVNSVDQQALGINVKTNQVSAKSASSLGGESSSNVDDLVEKRIEAAVSSDQPKSQGVVSWSVASSRADLPKTVELTGLYNDKSSGQQATTNISEPAIKPQAAANAQIATTVAVAKIEAGNAAMM